MSKLSLFSFFIVILSCKIVASGEMTFRYDHGNHTTTIFAEGDIKANTPEVLRRLLNTDGPDGFNVNVYLNSNGGDLLAGMELGKIFRERGFRTTLHYTGYENESGSYGCFSACALAFLGGVEREVPEDGNKSLIGFHQFYKNVDFEVRLEDVLKTQRETQFLSAIIFRYIIEMGASSQLFEALSLTRPSQMYFPDKADYKNLGITTSRSFSDFQLEPYGSGLIAYARSETNTLSGGVFQVTLYCRGSTPHVLFSVKDGEYTEASLEINRQNIIENQDGFYVWSSSNTEGRNFPKENVSVKTVGNSMVEARLDDLAAESIKSGTSMGVDIHYWYGNWQVTIEPTPLDERKISSAFSFCIE